MRIATFAVAATLVALAGCGSDGNSTAEVSGTVTVDGKPLPEGKITFAPIEGAGQTASGKIKDGKYSVTGVHTGLMKVTFNAPGEKVERDRYGKGGPTRIETKEGLPPSCNIESNWQLDVKPGPNTKDYDLPGS